MFTRGELDTVMEHAGIKEGELLWVRDLPRIVKGAVQSGLLAKGHEALYRAETHDVMMLVPAEDSAGRLVSGWVGDRFIMGNEGSRTFFSLLGRRESSTPDTIGQIVRLLRWVFEESTRLQSEAREEV